MSPLAYLVPRLARHFMPEGVTRFLLLRSLIIKPGLETIEPIEAIRKYEAALAECRVVPEGKRVLVFGYGGRFDIGIGLLRAGAAHVTLCDRYARPDNAHNVRLFGQNHDYLELMGGVARPRPERMVLLHADIRNLELPNGRDRFEVVISNSVYEHLDDAAGATGALRALTTPGGIHVHFVDLRDHFFKYPFEMLRFSESIWRNWLNPTSNHNRLRLWDYQRIFTDNFHEVEIRVLGRDPGAFDRIRPFVRPEFLNGQAEEEDVTLIRIVARRPKA